ncbi:MAG: PAS domain-containing protein, partial [Candidatus Krumholzibacteria bacterium]|nr:PAS domain-containing protein [Candidatus Krumholzibacteria bacterium]
MKEDFSSALTGGRAAFVFIRLSGDVPTVAGFGEDAAALFGRPPGETIGREAGILFCGDEAPRFAALLRHMRDSKAGVSGEFTMVDAGGRTFPALVAIGPCQDPEGDLATGHGVIIDLSARSETEAQLLASRRELADSTLILETMFDAIPDVIGIQDDSHRIIRYNDAGYRFINSTPERVEGKRCFELIGRTERCEVCATTRAIETKRPARVERYEKTMDIWLDVRAYPVIDASGNVVRVIEHLRDITQLKRAEAKLREAERHHRLLLEGQRD